VDRLYDLQSVPNEEGEPEPVVVRMTPEAKSARVAYYNAHAVEQRDLTGDLAAAWSKLEETPARLALVIHFIRWATAYPAEGSPEADLDLQSIAGGIRLVTWFKRETDRVYDLLAEDDADANQRRLTEWIGRRGPGDRARNPTGMPVAASPRRGRNHAGGVGRFWPGGMAGSSHDGQRRPADPDFKPTGYRRTTEAHVGDGGSVDVDTVDVSPPPPPAGPHGGGEQDGLRSDRLFPEPRGLPD